MNPFISTAYAQTAGGGASPAASFGFFAPLGVVFLIFYFLVIRPQQKQQKDRLGMISALQKGESVVLTSGIYAKVVENNDKFLTVEIAPNVKVKCDREAVSRKAE